jgi:hypothetical protein
MAAIRRPYGFFALPNRNQKTGMLSGFGLKSRQQRPVLEGQPELRRRRILKYKDTHCSSGYEGYSLLQMRTSKPFCIKLRLQLITTRSILSAASSAA